MIKMAASSNNPFQSREGEKRPLECPPLRPVDDNSSGELAASISATPQFVLAPMEPPQFAIGAAQRSPESNVEQSTEIEPPSGTQHVPKLRTSKAILRVPPINQQSIRFQKLQEYEGEVLLIRGLDLVARLTDLTDIGAQRLEATFALDEISPSDKPLLHEGAIFYWVIGFKDYPNGQRKTEQFLRFRRLPIWSSRDIKRLESRVEELKAFLQSDD